MEVWWECSLNLLFINYEFPPIGGGAANATWELARAMLKMGHTVTVLTSRTPNSKGHSSEENIEVYRLQGLRVRSDRSNMLEMFIFICAAILRVTKIARVKRIEATICFFSLPIGPLGLWLKFRLGIPYLISLRGGDVPGLVPELTLIHQLLTPIRRLILSNAQTVIANSQELAQRSQRADPFDIVVIPNGVDSGYYSPRPQVGHPDNSRPVKLLFVGRLQKQKDLPRLLDCLSLAKNTNGVNFELCVVGDGPERRKAVLRSFQLGLGQQVEWLGWLDKQELREVYRDSDCLVSLSSFEGLPNVVLEAMSCALPVIVSNIKPHRELVEDGINGFLVDLEKPEGFSEKVSDIVRNRDILRTMGGNGRQIMVRRFTWGQMAHAYIGLLTNSSTSIS
jgi:glycosyltransferase involved in cell wall biosynthesis